MTKTYTDCDIFICMCVHVLTHTRTTVRAYTQQHYVHTSKADIKTSTTKKPTFRYLLYAKNVNRRQYFWLGNEN